MTTSYVCGICGRSVATFSTWADVEPSDILELLRDELRGHNVNTTGLDSTRVLSRFRIVDDDDEEGQAAGEPDDGRWVGQ